MPTVELPQTGGSYIRQPNGSLQRVAEDIEDAVATETAAAETTDNVPAAADVKQGA